tara:strand:+ start:979 stop:1467 length:489 start_codon:yes stop_codon:yes gene_type:complete
MTLQSSGAISMSDIGTELSNASRSLRTLSAAAGFSTPDSMAEFYSYSSGSFNWNNISTSTSDPSVNTNTTTTNIGSTITLRFNLTKTGNDANHYLVIYKNGSSQVQLTSGDTDLTSVVSSDTFFAAVFNSTEESTFTGTITVTDVTNSNQLDTASISMYREP